MFTRIVRLVVIGWIVSMVAGAVAALQARRRIGPTPPRARTISSPAPSSACSITTARPRACAAGRSSCGTAAASSILRDATLAPAGATLNVKVVFGGGQVLVPADWRVLTAVSGLGGVQDVRGAKGYAEDAPTLTIAGTLIGGGFAVQSEPDEAMNAIRGRSTRRPKRRARRSTRPPRPPARRSTRPRARSRTRSQRRPTTRRPRVSRSRRTRR